MDTSACCRKPEMDQSLLWRSPDQQQHSPDRQPQSPDQQWCPAAYGDITECQARLSPQDSDQVLIAAAQKGFRQAFDWLVVRYQARIMHAIANYIRDRDAVVDVAQETFIRAFKGISKFRSDSNFYTWLYRIAINTSYIHLNKERSRFPIVDNETSELAIANQASEPIDEPENIILGKELQHRLQKAVEGLPPDQRTAFLLLEESGLHYADIAEITRTPIGTVRSRIFRARESLANQLTDIC